MASEGQRFRRKALRRGYKVDEVDAFLDRVEATLAGTPVGAPVTAAEVHDVVFRVRFGGYDEWQVDLHLDRAERQIAELEERRGGPRGPEPRGADRMAPPPMREERGGPPMGPPDRFGAPPMREERGGPPMGPPDRFGPPPVRDERVGPGMPPPMPPRPMPAQAGPPDPYSRYDEPTGSHGGFDGGPRGGYEGLPRGQVGPPGGHGGLVPPPPAARVPGGPGGYGPAERFNGFEPGRHGKPDMTTEIRMPDREPRPPMRGPVGMPPGPPPAPAGMSPGPAGMPPGPPPAPAGMPPAPPPGMAPPGLRGDAQRVDQIRRSFQVRRFGSGYDPEQVDRLFQGILSGMAGRGPMPVNPAELDSMRFGLVPGGYYEAEVDAALREVKDILRRQ